jgi:hypothetical protein
MNRRELLERMDQRIARTEGRIERLARWMQWTAYRESVELARRAAIESLGAWRALRGTILETWRLVRHRGSDGEVPIGSGDAQPEVQVRTARSPNRR